MNLTIHCTRHQIYELCSVFGKWHFEKDGTRTIQIPNWLKVMYKYAKVHEFREKVSQSRMITYPHN